MYANVQTFPPPAIIIPGSRAPSGATPRSGPPAGHKFKKGKHMKHVNRIHAFLAAAALATTVGCAGTQTHESTGQYVDDTAITTKVKTAILEDASLKSTGINVETFKGVVQLSGFVSSQASVDHAVVVAQNVHGVKSVKNDMRVK